MPRELDEPTKRPDDERPVSHDRRWGRARLAAAAGLSAAVIMGVVAPTLAGPAAAQSVADCVNEVAVRVTAEAVRLPADQRAAYIRAQVDLARARCGALATTTSTTTTTPPTTTTTTTSPTTTTTTPRPRKYTVVATGVIGPGRQTLTASCDVGDTLVGYDYVVGTPTGSNTSRVVNVSSSGRTVQVAYTVTGTVADTATSLTVTCRHR